MMGGKWPKFESSSGDARMEGLKFAANTIEIGANLYFLYSCYAEKRKMQNQKCKLIHYYIPPEEWTSCQIWLASDIFI